MIRGFRAAVAVGLCATGAVLGTESSPSGPPVFDPGDPRGSFVVMAEHLSRDGGRWRAKNPHHDPADEGSPPEFGLDFERTFDGRVLVLTILVHYGDRTIMSSQGQWVWHPGEQRLDYSMVGRNDGLTEGTTDFPDATTFRTVATLFLPSGESHVHRDDNFVVGDSIVVNETFERSEAGVWVSQGVFEWHREVDPTWLGNASIVELRGHLVWGHEVRSFAECGSKDALWFIDETGGEVRRRYQELSSDPYEEVLFEVRGRKSPPPETGFGADYDGGLTILEVVEAGPRATPCDPERP